ncbi:unnamed protein product, partial [Prorocentrum cordatum]
EEEEEEEEEEGTRGTHTTHSTATTPDARDPKAYETSRRGPARAAGARRATSGKTEAPAHGPTRGPACARRSAQPTPFSPVARVADHCRAHRTRHRAASQGHGPVFDARQDRAREQARTA